MQIFLVTLFGLFFWEKWYMIRWPWPTFSRSNLSFSKTSLNLNISQNGLTYREEILQCFHLGLGSQGREKQCHYIVKVCPPGRRILNSGGRSYLEIGKSVWCQILSVGNHNTSSVYPKKVRFKMPYQWVREIDIGVNNVGWALRVAPSEGLVSTKIASRINFWAAHQITVKFYQNIVTGLALNLFKQNSEI